MSEPNQNLPEQNLASPVSEAQQLLEQIKEVKAQTEEQLKAAELARKNADSEALYASNAKSACEGHSTAIASLKGSVEVDVNSIITNKQKSDELLAAVNTGKATIDADIRTINERRKEVDLSALEILKAAEVGASRLKDIDASKNSAEAVLKLTNEAHTAAAEASAGAEGANKQAQKLAGEATIFTSSISDNQRLTKQHADETQILLLDAQTTEANLKKVLDHLTKSDDIATGH